MGVISGVVVFLLVWWMVLFTVLPWGLQRDEDGTPRYLNLKKKLLITTVLSVGIWFVIYFIASSDLISFHDMAEALAEADKAKVGQE